MYVCAQPYIKKKGVDNKYPVIQFICLLVCTELARNAPSHLE